MILTVVFCTICTVENWFFIYEISAVEYTVGEIEFFCDRMCIC